MTLMLDNLVKREMGKSVMEICKDLPVQKSLALLRKYKWDLCGKYFCNVVSVHA